ncbi:LOW QUALITY PROTEIN: Ribonuclease H-like domain containing protein [Trema orientale]|uniref:Ribonuclease H-like domain containing protein n=1 Tax=Trema orientale TaxID=63057 RepID=A0A2P5CBZ9_TREOI|nr:LOW QUALITY PROTEIN: Ribonuclease H-like domain containing protein [Trema orientale]
MGGKGSVLDGEFMHLRCCAHIIKLIVSGGLKDLNQSISVINAVRYIWSSPARLVKFKACFEKEKIDYKGLLVLDMPTRWNSTYMILDVAIKLRPLRGIRKMMINT